MVSPVPVPGDESVTINGAWLGPGRQVHGDGPGPAVAWASERVVHQPGLHWRLIVEESAVTSLQPILLSSLDGSAERPWDSGEFDAPGDAADIDRCDAASLPAEGWGDHEPSADEIAADGAEWWADYNSMFEPYGGEFPGLAPAIDDDIDPLRLEVALGQYLSSARIGLVSAARPADVLTALGWRGVTNRGWQPAQVSAVLRSWEDRYGARLLEVGFAELRLVVSRPRTPQTIIDGTGGPTAHPHGRHRGQRGAKRHCTRITEQSLHERRDTGTAAIPLVLGDRSRSAARAQVPQ